MDQDSFLHEVKFLLGKYKQGVENKESKRIRELNETNDVLNNLPIVKKLKERIVFLENEIQRLTNSSENKIYVEVDEISIDDNDNVKNKQEIEIESVNVIVDKECELNDPFNEILDKDFKEEEFRNLTPFYQKLWLEQDKPFKVINKKQEEEEVEEEEEEEEVEQEEEEEEVEEVEQEEEEEEEVEQEEEEEEDEEEVEEVIINGKSYFTNNKINGTIYVNDNDDVGDEVGKYVNGKPKFD